MMESTSEMCLVDVMIERLHCLAGGVHRRDKGRDAAFYETGCYGNYQQKTQKVGAYLSCGVVYYC